MDGDRPNEEASSHESFASLEPDGDADAVTQDVGVDGAVAGPVESEITDAGTAADADDSHAVQTLQISADGSVTTPVTIPAGAGGGDDAAQVRPGEVWNDDFEFIRLLGRGGMGAVYLGHQRSLDRRVAIKVLPQQMSRDDNFRQRFALEARAVARLNSPHVTQVYTAGQHLGHHYFVMEFIDGRDLAGRLRGGYRPDHATALDLIHQATLGLEMAHRQDIIHRDIKPGNMMVDENGRLKLMDFGLVKLAQGEQDTSLTMAGTVMGTASYLSPEQAMGDVCDGRTDLYALGIVFYELLTGRLPFVGKSPTAVIFKHINEAPKPPQEIDPTIPEDYQAVVLKCLQKDPADRYQTATELLRDLDALRDGESPRTALLVPSLLRTGATMIKTSTFRKERQRSRRLVGIVVLLLLLGGGLAGWRWRQQLANLIIASSSGVNGAGAAADDEGLRQARQALADGQVEVVTRLLAMAGEPGQRPAGWEALAKELQIAEAARRRSAIGHEVDRVNTLLGNSDVIAALEILDRLTPVDLGEVDRRSVDNLRERAKQLREFLRLGDAALVDNDLAGAGSNYTAANLVIANRAASDGIAMVSLCTAFDNAMTKSDVAGARQKLVSIIAAKPDNRVVARRERRIAAIDAVDAARAKLADGRLGEARTLLLKAEDLDPDCIALVDLRRTLDVGTRELALAAALMDERLPEAERLTCEIEQLDPQRGREVRAQLVEVQHCIAQRQQALHQQQETERQRQEAERHQREALEARISALQAALAKEEPDLTAVAAELAALDQALPQDQREALPTLREALDQRGAEIAVRDMLTRLDAAVLAGDQAGADLIVVDAGHCQACRELMGQEGLSFAHRLVALHRGETITADVVLRTGMQLAPAQDFPYRYTLEHRDGTWRIAKVEATGE